jgi:simple sugar transport system ATP-binding protein
VPAADKAPPAFELLGISKRFGDVVANDRVDLAVEPGEIHGLVGENGAGKTTLMKVLYGMHRPERGEIRIGGSRQELRSPLDAIALGLGMVHQHFMLFPSLTVAENVVFGAEPHRRGLLDSREASTRVRALADRYGLEVDPEAPVGALPVGVKQRVEILKALYRGARILILDEPTAVLTPLEREALLPVLRRLAGEGTTIVFITHKLPEVLAVCDRATVLRDGRVAGTLPVPETTAEELSRLMVGREVEAVAPEAGHAIGEPVLEIHGLRVLGADGRPRVEGLDLTVSAGEIVGIAGAAGNGQSELAKAVAGLRSPAAGSVRIAGRDVTSWSMRERRRASLAYVPEDRDGAGLAVEATVAENLLMGFEERAALAPRGLLRPKAVHEWARATTSQYRVKLADVDDAAAALSGGNRQKLVVGRELAHESRLLVVEQPTRGVDLAAIEIIHRELVDYCAAGGALLLISSELTELRTLADRIVVMLGGRIVGELGQEEASEEALGLLMAGVG